MKNHIGYYTFLFTILALGVFLSQQVSYSRQLQMLTVVITAFFYVGFGIIHHLANHDLTAKIVIEYMLIGGLVITVVSFVLKGAF